MGTYNVNGRRPPQGLSLRPWLDAQQTDADIVAVGFQEIVPLSAGNVVMGEPACLLLSSVARLPTHRYQLHTEALTSRLAEILPVSKVITELYHMAKHAETSRAAELLLTSCHLPVYLNESSGWS